MSTSWWRRGLLSPAGGRSGQEAHEDGEERGANGGGTGSRQGGAGAAKGRFSGLPGGNSAIGAFCLSLVAFTIQTEAAQYVQQTLGYRKPFLSLYMGHSGFILLFPMHLAYLRLAHPEIPLSHWLHLIAQNLHWQVSTPTHAVPLPASDRIRRRISSLSLRLSQSGRESEALPSSQHSHGRRQEQGSAEEEEERVSESGQASRRPRSNSAPPPYSSWIEEKMGFNLWKLLRMFAVLTLGITVPALSWYSAVPLTTMADITTIYNTYAVWALVFSIWFLGESWERRKVFSVLLACGGVILVAYGGAEHRRRPREKDPVYGKPGEDPALNAATEAAKFIARKATHTLAKLAPHRREENDKQSAGQNPVLGDFLAFVGAVTMAAYEMAFKVVGTLPDEQAQNERYSAVSRDRTARAQSYAGYERASAPAAEEQGLLGDGDEEDERRESRGAQKSNGEAVSELQHIVGNDDDDDENDEEEEGGVFRGRAKQSTERTAIWKEIDTSRNGSPSSYQAIGAPQEVPSRGEDLIEAGDLGRASSDVAASSTRNDNSKRKSVKINEEDEVDARKATNRKDSTSEDDAASEEESVLGEGEIEEIQRGSTRLHRTKSASTVGRTSLRNVFDLDEEEEEEAAGHNTRQRPKSSRMASSTSIASTMHQEWMPPPLPFGLHAIIVTSGIGLVTFTTLWIGIPIAHMLSLEPFELPHNFRTVLAIVLVVFMGILFNGCFSILLSLWGPVLASVSCLLTTVLVFFADLALGNEFHWISLLGCVSIAAGFGVLVSGGNIH